MKPIIAAWERFWFAPESTSTVAVWRVAFGLLMLGWTIALAPDLFAFFSSHGIISEQPVPPTRLPLGLLRWFPSDAALVSAYAVLLLASVCLTVGYHSRVASLVVFVGVLSFQARNPFIFNSGDLVIRAIAFYIALAPTGVALSLDQWRKGRDRFWECPARAPWALRLMQIQLSVIYLTTVLAKVRGETWSDGTAVSYALRITDILRFPLPSWLTENALAANLMTYGTLALELALGILIWNRRLRPVLLLAGVLFHLAIDYAILVGFFSFAMFVCYTVFISPDWLDARLARLRERLERAGPHAPHAWLPAPMSRCLLPGRGRLLIGAGIAIQATGLTWDVVLRFRSLGVVHGTLGLENPAHSLYLAGLVVCGWGVLSELSLARVRRRTGFSLRASLAAPVIVAVCVTALLVARAGAAALLIAPGTPNMSQHRGHVHRKAGPGDGLGLEMNGLQGLTDRSPWIAVVSHLMPNLLGRHAAKLSDTPAEALRECRHPLMGGCYDDVLEAYVDTANSIELDHRLLRACDGDMPANVRHQCFHGLGHVVAAFADHHLFRALGHCGRLAARAANEACYGGVFMENVLLATEQLPAGADPALRKSDSARHAYFLKPDDPLYPCNAVAKQHRAACYLVQSSAMLLFNGGDFAKAGQWCARAPGPYVAACYESLGRDISGATRRDEARSIEMCSMFSPPYQEHCLVGIMRQLADETDRAMIFCGKVPVSSRPACYEGAAHHFATYYQSTEKAVEKCTRAQPEHVDTCTQAARKAPTQS